MAVTLAEKFLPYVDEQFKAESKKSLLTNQDFNWTGAHTVKIYKISTAAMTDYGRTGPTGTNWSRYGAVAGLDAATEELTLSRDRSFTFAIDAMDADETGQTLTAASALARQLREVVIPEIDGYVFGKMCTGAGTKPAAAELTAANIYGEILKAGAALDAAEVPETGRQLLVTPGNPAPYEAEYGYCPGNRHRRGSALKGRDLQPGRGQRDPGARLQSAGGLRVFAGAPQRHGGACEAGKLQHPPEPARDQRPAGGGPGGLRRLRSGE